MDVTSDAALSGGDAPAFAPQLDLPAQGDVSVSEAARALVKARYQKPKEQEQAEPAGAQAQPEPPIQESADEADDAAPLEEAPGESETKEAEPAPEPPIEPPRSWTKEAKERWQSLPRETQEYLSTREQERDREIRRLQNEHAEKLKGITTKEQEAEQVRQQYEAALPQLLQALQAQQAGAFSDIKTMEDVTRLAQEDPARYLQWDAYQKQVAATQRELAASQERQAKEYQQKWAEFAAKEDKAFLEKVPELADKTKAAKLQDGALAILKDIGFNDQELASLWQGQASLSLRDHRLQLLILDGVRYREAQEKAKTAVQRPLPPVQRPGVAQSKGTEAQAQIQALQSKLEKTGSLKDAAALIAARRAAR